MTKHTIQTHQGEFSFDSSQTVNSESYIPTGEFNPHNTRPFLVHNEFGVLGVVYASSLQDALDEMVDSDKLDSCLVSDEDYAEADKEGYADDYASLGNASEPFDLTYIGFVELPNRQYGKTE
jgi:hypothetical protein